MGQSDYEGLKTCYNLCVSQHDYGCTDMSAASAGGASVQDTMDRAYDYYLCVIGKGGNSAQADIKASFHSAYCSTGGANSDTPADNTDTQNGYCNFFWNLLTESEMNQSQLKDAFEACFLNECTYDASDDAGTVNNGAPFFGTSFKSCIQGCADSAQVSEEFNFGVCEGYCGAMDTTVTTEYTAYQKCIGENAACGYLDYLTFADFQYASVYSDCYDDCRSTYDSAVNDSSDTNTVYFACVADCDIPSAESYTRLDNTVASTDVSRIMFSVTILAVILAVFF